MPMAPETLARYQPQLAPLEITPKTPTIKTSDRYFVVELSPFSVF